MRLGSLLALALASGACDRPRPLLICHNGNCSGARDVADDDSLDALRESLLLRWEGRPLLDGVEIDTMWHRAGGACLFDHGPGVDPPAETALEAAGVIAAYLAEDDVAWNGERFHLIVELKPYVAGRWDEHSEAELDLHAGCALDVYDRITTAAGGHRLRIVFEAEPRLLAALVEQPSWPGRLDGDVEVRLAVEGSLLADVAFTDPALSIDVIEYRPAWTTDGQLAAYSRTGADLAAWMYVTTPEALASIRTWSPRYVITGDAALLRRWSEE